jgi:hypothetical protein
MQSELHVIKAANCAGTPAGAPTQLTPDADGNFAAEPSWSATPGDRRIAFVQLTPVPGFEFDFHRQLAVIDPDTADVEVLVDDPNADQAVAAPSFGTNGEIAFQWDTLADTPTDNELWIVGASPGLTPRKLTDGPSDGDPSLSGQLLALRRPESGQDDIFLGSFRRNRLVAVGHSPAGTNTVPPENLRLDLFLSCGTGGARFPIAVGLVPTSTAGRDMGVRLRLHAGVLRRHPDGHRRDQRRLPAV